jgi:hypothetical protein
MKLNYNIHSIKNFYLFEDKNKKKLIAHILNDKDKHDNKPKSKKELQNFRISPHPLLNNLYEEFLKECKNSLGDFTIYQKNSKDLFSLCTNKNYYSSVPHDHISTSTIVGVYYLNIPDDKAAIIFDIDKKWRPYMPTEGELLIFPNYLKHDTLQNNTEEWRISINMEILCDHLWLR